MPAFRDSCRYTRVGFQRDADSSEGGLPLLDLNFTKEIFEMSRLIETVILYLALTAFAIYGVTWGAEKVGKILNQQMIKTSSVKPKVSL